MRKLAVAVVFAAALLPSAAGAEGFPANSFAIELRLAGGTGIAGLIGNFLAVPSLTFGGRIADRVQVGLGFSFFRSSTAAGGTATTTDNNVVNFAPTVSVDAFKSNDNRAAFYIKFALPLGPVITCVGNLPCDNGFAVGFDLALGARYAVHRIFAVGLEAGTAGSYINPQRQGTNGVVYFYGALVGTVYFSRS